MAGGSHISVMPMAIKLLNRKPENGRYASIPVDIILGWNGRRAVDNCGNAKSPPPNEGT